MAPPDDSFPGRTMGFLSKLFSRTKNQRLLRTQSQPLAPDDPPHSDEDSDDEDAVGMGLEYEPQAWRRVACELRRSRSLTRVEMAMGNIRSGSMSSAASELIHPDDVLQSTYTKMRPIHRGRHATILHAVERKTRRTVILKAYAVPDDRPSSTSTSEQATREHALLLRLALTRNCSDSGGPGGCNGTGGRAYRPAPLRSASRAGLLGASPPQAAYIVPGVARPLGLIHDTEQGQLYVALEYAQGQTLIELMASRGGRLSEVSCCVEVVLPLLVTLVALHAAGIVHRQIQPEHVLCHNATTRLIDFFHAADKKTQALNQRVGTLEYMAPEVLSKPLPQELFHVVLECGISEEELPTYDQRCDVWSLGVLVYEALTGCQPFGGDTAAEVVHAQACALRDQTKAVPDLISRHKQLTPLAQDFLWHALCLDPAGRWQASELLDHPWVSGHAMAHATALNPSGRMRSARASSFGESASASPHASHHPGIMSTAGSLSGPLLTIALGATTPRGGAAGSAAANGTAGGSGGTSLAVAVAESWETCLRAVWPSQQQLQAARS